MTYVIDVNNLEASMGWTLFLNMKDMVDSGKCNAYLINDYKTLITWINAQSWQGYESSDFRKKFTATWLSYLGRGVSPSRELRDQFMGYKATAVQNGWPRFDVPQDIFDVFDRLLATDDQIAEARGTRRTSPNGGCALLSIAFVIGVGLSIYIAQCV